jgi:hypothetical protein
MVHKGVALHVVRHDKLPQTVSTIAVLHLGCGIATASKLIKILFPNPSDSAANARRAKAFRCPVSRIFPARTLGECGIRTRGILFAECSPLWPGLGAAKKPWLDSFKRLAFG